jgi:sialic acid synthase SpsE
MLTTMAHTRAGITIHGRSIAAGRPLYVVAEIGLNHDGSVDRALALVDAAVRAGAHAVKLQSLRGDTLVAEEPAELAHVKTTSLRAFFRRYELDEEAHRRIAERARACGLAFISSAFDEDAVDMLERLGCDAYKIASGDLTHHQLIARAAATGKPVILSTGLSELDEVAEAVECARDAGASDLAILHCVSAYPVPEEQQNLGAIRTLASVFGVPVGLSDHSRDAGAATVAVALGACLYERHVKRDHDDAVIDADVSSTPEELAAVVRAARWTLDVMGEGRRTPQPAERPNLAGSRRAIYARRAIAAGQPIAADDLIALRPARGLDVRYWKDLLGLRAVRALALGEAFTDEDLPVTERKGGRRGAA